jgi:2-dehydropantoate 2-reductase
MNIIVFGAGAIGSVYAAKLSRHHDVMVIARPAHVDAINRDGLRIEGQQTFRAKVRAATAIEDIAPNAVVLLTTKVYSNHEAATAIARHVRPDTIIVCIQNGLHAEQVVREIMAGRCVVLRAITQFGAIFASPGVVDLRVAGFTLLEKHERSDELAALFTESGLDGRVSPDINIDVWRKLIFNCVINPITAIIGSTVGAIADARLDPLKQLVIDECLAVARVEGVTFGDDFQQALRDQYGSSRNTVSMRQDLLNGKRTEIDYMNGAVVALGQRHGIDCPVNAALVAIVKAMEKAGARGETNRITC